MPYHITGLLQMREDASIALVLKLRHRFQLGSQRRTRRLEQRMSCVGLCGMRSSIRTAAELLNVQPLDSGRVPVLRNTQKLPAFSPPRMVVIPEDVKNHLRVAIMCFY